MSADLTDLLPLLNSRRLRPGGGTPPEVPPADLLALEVGDHLDQPYAVRRTESGWWLVDLRYEPPATLRGLTREETAWAEAASRRTPGAVVYPIPRSLYRVAPEVADVLDPFLGDAEDEPTDEVDPPGQPPSAAQPRRSLLTLLRGGL